MTDVNVNQLLAQMRSMAEVAKGAQVNQTENAAGAADFSEMLKNSMKSNLNLMLNLMLNLKKMTR